MFDWLIPAAQAQQAAPALSSTQSFLTGPLPLLLMIPIFYFLIIRPQTKRAREQKDMLTKLAKGDEIIITGGLAGRITQIGEAYLTLEIADKVEVKVQKGAVTTVLPKGSLKNL